MGLSEVLVSQMTHGNPAYSSFRSLGEGLFLAWRALLVLEGDRTTPGWERTLMGEGVVPPSVYGAQGRKAKCQPLLDTLPGHIKSLGGKSAWKCEKEIAVTPRDTQPPGRPI